MVSLPGVFAHGRLDAGSSLLLDALEKLKPSGRVLDFACGSGVIGLAIASATTSVELTLLDVSAIALEAAGLSLAANDIQGELIASEGLDEAPGRFDWLLSNPPFHQGVAENRDIASVFIHRAGTFLNPGGKIVIVCNRHLPWAAGLRERFERVERLDANREYEVLLAANPRTR
jgi:16S rRNA (guanine1207-N2)-methyltransferase